MRVNTSKSEAMLHQKTVDCSPWVGTELLPQAKGFTYLRILFTSEHKMEHKMDRWIGVSNNTGIVMDYWCEEGAETEGKAFHLLVNLFSNPSFR